MTPSPSAALRATVDDLDLLMDQLRASPPDGAVKLSPTEDGRLHAEWTSSGQSASFTTLSN